jgi:hypothetical protein
MEVRVVEILLIKKTFFCMMTVEPSLFSQLEPWC